MGAIFSPPSIPTPAVPVTPPAALPATLANANVAMSGATQRSSAAAAAGAGFSGTLTNTGGATGQTSPNTAPRSLLG